MLEGDIPAIVKSIGGALARPYDFTRLVEALLEIGADDDALDYAIRGVSVSPVQHQTIPLYDTAVRMLRDRGDTLRVLELRRQQLATFPVENSYTSLRRAAKERESWPNDRLNALDVLLARNPRAWAAVLLAEGETALVWDTAPSLDLDEGLRINLLRARAKTHPGEVFEAYADLVLGELRRTVIASGREGAYDELVAELLDRHRRRPTLVAMLARLPRLAGDPG